MILSNNSNDQEDRPEYIYILLFSIDLEPSRPAPLRESDPGHHRFSFSKVRANKCSVLSPGSYHATKYYYSLSANMGIRRSSHRIADGLTQSFRVPKDFFRILII